MVIRSLLAVAMLCGATAHADPAPPKEVGAVRVFAGCPQEPCYLLDVQWPDDPEAHQVCWYPEPAPDQAICVTEPNLGLPRWVAVVQVLTADRLWVAEVRDLRGLVLERLRYVPAPSAGPDAAFGVQR